MRATKPEQIEARKQRAEAKRARKEAKRIKDQQAGGYGDASKS